MTLENLRHLAPSVFPLCSPYFTLKFSLFIEDHINGPLPNILSDDCYYILMHTPLILFLSEKWCMCVHMSAVAHGRNLIQWVAYSVSTKEEWWKCHVSPCVLKEHNIGARYTHKIALYLMYFRRIYQGQINSTY